MPSNFIPNELSSQLQLLLELIYETSNCRVKFDLEGIHFITKNNGRISRGNGAHAAAMPALAFALGDKTFANKKTLDTGYKMPNDFFVKFDDRLKSENIRDQLLKYELERFFISQQNKNHYAKHGAPHPVSGKGATDTENLCRDAKELGLGFEVSVEHENTQRFVKINVSDAAALAEFKKEFPVRYFKEGENFIALSQQSLCALLDLMRRKKINYQGVIPLDKNGAVFLALRKNPGQIHSLGYATCGGHCSDPYHPEIAAAVDLEHEFGMPLKSSENTKSFKLIDQINDVAVFSVSAKDFEAQKFSPVAREFVAGTGEVMSFKEIRDRRLPLRNIPSLDLYLKFCEKKLNEFQTQLGVSKILVPYKCQISQSGVVQFPENNFGVIEFFGVNPHALAKRLEDKFGGTVKIDEVRNCVTIEDLNPGQIIDFLEGRKNKADLQKYRQDQEQKDLEYKAAVTIQNAYRNRLARKELENQTLINIAEMSRENLSDIQQTLRQATIRRALPKELFEMDEELDLSMFELDLVQKRKENLFSAQEKELFRAFCQMPLYLYHATYANTGLAIENNDHIFSPVNARRYGVEGEKTLYDQIGMGRNICFNIGSKELKPFYFRVKERETLFRMDFKSLLANKEFYRSAWLGETLIRFYREKTAQTLHRIGDGSLTQFYPGLTDSESYQTYKRSDGMQFSVSSGVGSKICLAKNLVEFLGYQLIENLRLLGGKTREYLLRNPYDETALALAADRIFSTIGLVVYVPTKVNISSQEAKTTRFEFRTLDFLSSSLIEAIEKGDVKAMETLKERNQELLQCCKLTSTALALPISSSGGFNYFINTAITRGKAQSVEWLVENNFFDEVCADFNLSGKASELMRDVLLSCKSLRAKEPKLYAEVIKVLEKNEILTPRVSEAFPELWSFKPHTSSALIGGVRNLTNNSEVNKTSQRRI